MHIDQTIVHNDRLATLLCLVYPADWARIGTLMGLIINLALYPPAAKLAVFMNI